MSNDKNKGYTYQIFWIANAAFAMFMINYITF